MTTVYNLTLGVENISDRVSYNDALNTLKEYYIKGLIGAKHVDSFGRIHNGYDDECAVTKKGVYRVKIAPELENIVDDAEGRDVRIGFQQQNASKNVFRQLGNYFSFKSSIETPVGRQSTVAYTEDKKAIKIFRLNSVLLYDKSVSVSYLNNVLKKFDEKFEVWEINLDAVQKRVKKRLQRQHSRAMDLYVRLVGAPEDVKPHELLLLRLKDKVNPGQVLSQKGHKQENNGF